MAIVMSKLVGNGVKHLAEVAYLIEAAGYLAVKEVAETREGEYKNRPTVSALMKEHGEYRHHDYAEK